MAEGTRNPSGVIENSAVMGLAAMIGVALSGSIEDPNWQKVVIAAAPIAGKLFMMLISALIGDTLGGGIKKGFSSLALVGAVFAAGATPMPAFAQEGSCQTEEHVEARFLGTGFVAYDYTAAVPVLGLVQINFGIECKQGRWIIDPVNIDATETLRQGATWIASKLGG